MNDIQMLHLVRERYTDLYWQGCVREYMTVGHDPMLTVDRLVEDGQGGYIWPDVDYDDQSRNVWRTADHYNRLLRMLCQEGRERLAEDADFREKAVGLVRHWVRMDYKNPNWWHNDIGMPNHMTALSLMMFDVLPADVREGMIALAARGSMQTRTDIPKWTGANLIWGVGNSIRHALLTEDVDLLSRAAARAQEEIVMGGSEGIQPDGSFYQHGPRWYSGGYGANFTFDIAQFAYIFGGTPWAISEERINILLTHVLDGQRHMMHHGFFDYNGVGRELTRRNSLRAQIIHYAVDMLSRIEDIPRRQELIDYTVQNRGGVDLTGPVPGAETRYYPAISYLAHNCNGIHIGVKCHAPEQYDMEVCNSEGYLCFNMSYGTRTCLMRRGDEYLNINGIFDYAHLPGTTARIESDEDLKTHVNWWCLPLPTDATVGLVEGDHGIVSEHPVHDGITAKVSFFTFGGRMIALGTDITDETPDRAPLTVTLDQCRVADPVIGESEASNGGFTYYDLDPATTLCASVEDRVGAWKRNSYEEDYEEERGQLFLCYIPVSGQGGSYAYGVAPRGEALGAKVIANNGAVQAILTDEGVLMAVFHEETAFEVEGVTLKGTPGACVIKSIRSI